VQAIAEPMANAKLASRRPADVQNLAARAVDYKNPTLFCCLSPHHEAGNECSGDCINSLNFGFTLRSSRSLEPPSHSRADAARAGG